MTVVMPTIGLTRLYHAYSPGTDTQVWMYTHQGTGRRQEETQSVEEHTVSTSPMYAARPKQSHGPPQCFPHTQPPHTHTHSCPCLLTVSFPEDIHAFPLSSDRAATLMPSGTSIALSFIRFSVIKSEERVRVAKEKMIEGWVGWELLCREK